MKQKSYLITNRGSSTISVVGRREFTIPKGCKDMEFSVPDTKEMKQRMARLKRKYPALKIVEVAETVEEQKATEAEPVEKQKVKKSKSKAKTEAVETVEETVAEAAPAEASAGEVLPDSETAASEGV